MQNMKPERNRAVACSALVRKQNHHNRLFLTIRKTVTGKQTAQMKVPAIADATTGKMSACESPRP
jgi:hypothetical protein